MVFNVRLLKVIHNKACVVWKSKIVCFIEFEINDKFMELKRGYMPIEYAFDDHTFNSILLIREYCEKRNLKMQNYSGYKYVTTEEFERRIKSEKNLY